MTLIPDDYLGDGVYASTDGYGITLDLRQQGTDRIYLEPETLAALDRFRKRLSDARAEAASKGND